MNNAVGLKGQKKDESLSQIFVQVTLFCLDVAHNAIADLSITR